MHISRFLFAIIVFLYSIHEGRMEVEPRLTIVNVYAGLKGVDGGPVEPRVRPLVTPDDPEGSSVPSQGNSNSHYPSDVTPQFPSDSVYSNYPFPPIWPWV